MPRRSEVPSSLKDSTDKVRSTVDMKGSSYYKLYKLTTEFGTSLGSVIDALVDSMDEDKIRKLVEKSRKDKSMRMSEQNSLRRLIYKSLKKPTLAQLELVDQLIEQAEKEKEVFPFPKKDKK
jgi:hypothetical protein